MFNTILKSAGFLAGFFALLWAGMRYGEDNPAPFLAAVIGYVAVWQFVCARPVAEGLTRHYRTTFLSDVLPEDKLAVTSRFVRGMALLFFAVSAAVWALF